MASEQGEKTQALSTNNRTTYTFTTSSLYILNYLIPYNHIIPSADAWSLSCHPQIFKTQPLPPSIVTDPLYPNLGFLL